MRDIREITDEERQRGIDKQGFALAHRLKGQPLFYTSQSRSKNQEESCETVMAFDQNSMPKDLRPLNIVRNVIEDPIIATVTSSGRPIEGFFASPPTNVGGSPGTIPTVYYPATVADSGFVPLGFNNAITGWVQHVVPSQSQPGVLGAVLIDSSSGYSNSPKFGIRLGSRASDQASEDSGNDSVSGRKIKFLCSFGGKILPRLSDGALRYVGGQTRIISVRRDATFGEFFQKMADTYAQNVVIKYQLPDEDLDALVTVSCADDLENMMDEYQNLIERSSDGSAKLRIFLFSPSELESAGLMHIGDMQDNRQRYVEAVNGIMDGFSGSGRIARKESIESAVSAQNSDMSGTEGADSIGIGLGDGTSLPSTGGFSPKGISAAVSDTAQKIVHGDANPFSLFDTSAPLSIPMVRAGPATVVGTVPEQQVERSVPIIFPQALPGVNYPISSPGTSPYAGPREETMSHANYVQMASQIGYPTSVLGRVFTQQPMPAVAPQQFSPAAAPQQFSPAATPQHYSPAMHMTMNPAFMSMKPNAVPTFIQPRQVHMEHYPGDKMVVQRVAQLPAEQGYNPHQAQVPVTVQEGVYNQISYPNQNTLNDPQQIPFPEKIPRLEDCQMCQKALPHAHSDTVAQDQKDSSSSTLSDMRSIYHSVQFDDQGRPMIRPVVAENNIEQLTGERRPRMVSNEDPGAGNIPTRAIGVLQKVEPRYADKILPQKVENLDLSKMAIPQGVEMPTAAQLPYGVFSANSSQPFQANAFQNPVLQTQFQPARDNIASNNDFAPVVVPPQGKDYYALRESPKEYFVKVSGENPADDATSSALDQLMQIDGRLENLRIPSEVLHTNELNKSAGEMRKEDLLESRPNQIVGKEALGSHYFPTTEPYEVMGTPSVGNTNLYLYPVSGINRLPPNDNTGNSLFSVVEPSLMAERTVPKNEARDNILWSQPRIGGDLDSVAHDGPSLSPSYLVGDVPDSSTSLFANQNLWNMNSDTHYPPPRPNKIQIRRDNAGLRDHPIDSRLPNIGEVGIVNCTDSQLDTPLDDGAFGQDYSASNKGSAEELIQQELQAVAEGVVASVLHSSGPSNPDITANAKIASPTISQQNGDIKSPHVEMKHRDKNEEVKTNLPEQTNFGFPASGMGQLQIIKNNDLEELRELGSGTFGTVFHGKWRGTDVAIKRINDRCFVGKTSEQDRMRNDFWNEAIKLADLHHPNVVAFYGVVLDGPDGSVATVTEYMVNGSLRNALQKNERILDKRKRLLIAMDVAFGMEYLHGKNIVHFDLKSDNLLVNLRDPHRPICKVGDLGLSKVKCHTLISGGVRGTLPWMAPELLNGSSSLVSEKVDVFSYGVVMWELLTGEEPYADLHYGAIIGGIVSNTLRPPVPEHCEADWRTLMERCWSSEPLERPTFSQIADDLRIIAGKLPTKAQIQQQLNPQVKK